MKEKKSITVNFVMNFILTASSILFPLISFPYVSRILGPSGTGSVAMGTSLVSYFTMVAMLGVPTYGIRACAAVRDNRELLSQRVQELLIINLIMAAISYSAFFITLILVPSFRTHAVLYTICSAAILLNVIGVNWVYQALEQYSYITAMSILFKVIGLAIMFIFVRNSQDTLWYALVTVISGFGSGLLNFIRLRTLICLHPVEHYDFKIHFRPILTFFAMSVATTIYTNLDVVMLGVMTDNQQVGYYNAAIKVKTIMVTLVTSLGTVLLPRLSYYYDKGEREKFHQLISKAFSFVLLFSIPVCLYFDTYAVEIIDLLSGSQYRPSVIPMIVLMPTIILIGLSNITGIQILVPMKKENLVLASVVFGAVIDFTLNLILIPYLGPTGAATGTLAAEFCVTLMQFWFLRSLLRRIVPEIEFPNLIYGLAAGLAALFFLQRLQLKGTLLTLIISAAVYFGIYGLVLLITGERILKETLNKVIKRSF